MLLANRFNEALAPAGPQFDRQSLAGGDFAESGQIVLEPGELRRKAGAGFAFLPH
jgi:hypothetical protein